MEMQNQTDEQQRQLARRVHEACLRVVTEQYEQAASDGLCAEGAWEVAVTALRALNLEPIIAQQGPAGESAE